MTPGHLRAIGVAGAALAMTIGAAAQSAAPAVFTAQQAIAGKTAFSKACSACHMPDLSGNNEVPPLAGGSFMDTWGDRTTKELFDYMSGAMPPGGPAQSIEAYESIVAFVLQSNGAVAGSEPFKAATDVPLRSVLKKR